jgi:hypothetical protein
MQCQSVTCCILSALEGEACSARFQSTLVKLTLCVYVVKAHKVTEGLLYSLLTSALDRDQGPASRPRRFKPRDTAISTHWYRNLWSSRDFNPPDCPLHSLHTIPTRLCFPRAFHSDWMRQHFVLRNWCYKEGNSKSNNRRKTSSQCCLIIFSTW